MSTEQDNILFARLKNEDREAFDLLFRKHYNRLCNFARSILKVHDTAEECVQEVFITLWEQRQRIDVTKSVIAFLYTCVKNNAFNKLEKEKTRRLYEAKYVLRTGDKTFQSEPSEGQESLISKILKQAVNSLPHKCREIFVMSRFEGLTYEEISEYLEVSVKTVENQMGIAFQKLRAYMVPKYKQFMM
jgi:RNA polymerase sigma-70 factor (ECF subfamily)